MKFNDDYVVFDLETTGLDPKYEEIIEIGALKYRDNKLVDSYSVLVKPKKNINDVITNITGITNEMVENEKYIEDVIDDFLNFIDSDVLVGHNVSFDISFINEALMRLNKDILSNDSIDTVMLARSYIPKVYNYKLSTLKNYFHLEFNSHRSIEDCKTTNYIYQECKKRCKEYSL